MTTMDEVLQRRGRSPGPHAEAGRPRFMDVEDRPDSGDSGDSGEDRTWGEERLAKGLGWFSIGLGALELAALGAVADWLGIEHRDRLFRAFGAREIASGIGILAQDRPVGWMWGRAAGDVMDLSVLAAALPGSERRGRVAASVGFVAGILALDFLCADRLSHRPGSRRAFSESGALEVRKQVTIDAPPDEVYRFWRDLENLPRFMRHLKSVQTIDAQHSHWVAKTAGMKIEWDAEIVDEDPGAMLAWRSLDTALVSHAGIVRFTPADPRPGTIVEVEMQIRVPLGPLARSFSNLFGKLPEAQVEMDLRALKQLIETGEVATTDGQPTGRPRLTAPASSEPQDADEREPQLAAEGGRS